MKSGHSRRVDYSQITIILLVAALVFLFIMLLTLSDPRQTSADDRINLRTARRLAVPVVQLDKVTTREGVTVAEIYCTVTAYSPTVAQTDASPLITASGKRVYVGGIAADLSVLPFGSIVIVDGYNNGNPCTVVDTGSLIRGNTLDVFYWHESEAIQWGRRRNVKVQVLYVPKGTR